MPVPVQILLIVAPCCLAILLLFRLGRRLDRQGRQHPENTHNRDRLMLWSGLTSFAIVMVAAGMVAAVWRVAF